MASYSRAVVAWKMCWNVTFGQCFDNNFWTVWNFWTQQECFRKYTLGAWIWTLILYFFDRNQESCCPLNMSHRITQNTDSNYVPMEGGKNGSLTFCSWIWHANIFPISRDKSSRNKIWVKKTLVASYSWAVIALKMCSKVTFGHRFDYNFWTVWNF